MGKWFRFFIGTPQRFLATAAAVGLVTVMLKPGLLQEAVNRLLAEIGPLLGPVAQLAIVIGVLWFMLRSLFGGGNRKR